jgi:hypothetical protein
MKNGFLFFWNMGRITTGARIALLPLIYLAFFQVRPMGIAFFTCLALLAVALLLSFIPAPSDKKAKATLERFRSEHKEEMMSRCGFVNDEGILLLHGYAEEGNMRLSRTLGREVIYPVPLDIGFANHLGKGRLLIGKRTLIKPLPAEYFFLRDEELTAVRIEMTTESETEEVARLTFSHPALPENLTMYVKNDFRVRDFLEGMKEIASQK